jgi:hypothetical protein
LLGERHERTDEDVAHPAFVGTFSFVPAEGTRLTSQRRAVETATVQMLADGALRNGDAMPRFQDRADLNCGATGQFQSQLASFLQEFRVAPYDAKIGTWRRTESVETMLSIGTDPAIERHT